MTNGVASHDFWPPCLLGDSACDRARGYGCHHCSRMRSKRWLLGWYGLLLFPQLSSRSLLHLEVHLLLCCHLLSHHHHLLRLLVELSVLGVDVQILLDEIAVLVHLVNFFQLVLRVVHLLLLAVLVEIAFRAARRHALLLHLQLVLEVWLNFILIYLLLFNIVVFALDYHWPNVVLFFAIAFVLSAFLILIQAHLLNQVLVSSQKLFNNFFWHRKLVWIFLVFVLQVLNENSLFVLVEIVNIDQLVFILFFSSAVFFLFAVRDILAAS